MNESSHLVLSHVLKIDAWQISLAHPDILDWIRVIVSRITVTRTPVKPSIPRLSLVHRPRNSVSVSIELMVVLSALALQIVVRGLRDLGILP